MFPVQSTVQLHIIISSPLVERDDFAADDGFIGECRQRLPAM
jgi:hypothetical protein